MRGWAAAAGRQLGGLHRGPWQAQGGDVPRHGIAALLQRYSTLLLQGAPSCRAASLRLGGAAGPPAVGASPHFFGGSAGCGMSFSSGTAGGGPPFVEHRGGRRTVAVAVSGGVDSATAASIMQQQGHEVLGVFMRNWDEAEERGNENCSVERDRQDAAAVCAHLGLPLVEVDFVAQYWQRVFQPFLDQYARGLTPNPDLACNRAIKFDALLRHARGLGADTLVTGHFARLRHLPDGGTQLLQGLDPLKDQSYFLAAVPASALAACAFPLGAMHKGDVRRAAAAAGSPSATRRSSAGICFIGRRKFGDFLSQYVPPVAGRLVGVGSGAHLGACPNVLALTHGQRAGIGGAASRMYVVGKDMSSKIVHVAEGGEHPAMYAETALLAEPHWVAGAPPLQLNQGQPLQLQFKARYGQPLHACTVQQAAAKPAFQPTQLSWYPDAAGNGATDDICRQLVVTFQRPMRAITPGQEFVLYDGEVCLGAAPVLAAGPSLWEQGRPLPLGLSADNSLHMAALEPQTIVQRQAAMC